MLQTQITESDNSVKRLIALALCILVLITSFISCESADERTPIMTCGNYSIDENDITYYLATYKGKFAKMYSDFDDSEDFYSSPVDEDGATMEDYLFDTTVDSVKMTLAGCALFDEYELSLADSIYDAVDEYIDALLEDYMGGDEEAFDKALAGYGIDKEALREIYLRDERVAALLDFLLDSGEITVTDAERTEYLAENYVRVRHIYVNTKYKYSTDEDGYLIYSENGYAQTEPLSPEELEKKNALMSAIDESIAGGGDFEEIYEGLSEDKLYPNGYYFKLTTDFIPEVVDAAFSLEVGEWMKVESDYGVHYVMRLEMDDRPWANDANSDFFGGFEDALTTSKFTEIIKEKTSDVTVNEEALSSFSIRSSPINYKF